MGDLRSSRLMVLKAVLFLVIGVMSGGMIWWESPTLRTGILLGLVVWSFSRAYYFAFYVIEHYIDPGYRFAGLTSAIRFLMRRSRG